MKFILQESGGHSIQRYAEGEVTVSEQTYRTSVIVLPDQIITDWSPEGAARLRLEDFARLAQLAPELVILGTGARQHFPPPGITHPLTEKHIGLEVMDTPAACRTYNILLAEGRRAAAALFMI